ncbi:MAG: riboflavin synthase [Bradymonadales bacterium]|nr:riboflavin synthase [Bradymonadales bacterium]
MFTGIIQAIGTVTQVTVRPRWRRIGIDSGWDRQEVAIGESVAVDGVCLTVTDKQEGCLAFDVSPESLERTTIGNLKRGHRVHLERALRLADRLSGHLVLGHVDGLGTLAASRREGECWLLELQAPAELVETLIPKGSIAVNGVSLTVNGYTTDSFSVMIVPHTAEQTLLVSLPAGSPVNLETDVIGKYVARLIGRQPEGESDDRLRRLLKEQGFL